jgi:hypothetical protein
VLILAAPWNQYLSHHYVKKLYHIRTRAATAKSGRTRKNEAEKLLFAPLPKNEWCFNTFEE